MIYICLILWISYSIVEGIREAHFWHHRIKSSDYEKFKHIDRHLLFAVQRGFVLKLLSVATYLIFENIWVCCYLFLMNCLIFSFFHNGAMYRERHRMSVMANPDNKSKWIYLKGWFDQSSTSTSKMTKYMTPIARTIEAFVGISGYFLTHLF